MQRTDFDLLAFKATKLKRKGRKKKNCWMRLRIDRRTMRENAGTG